MYKIHKFVIGLGITLSFTGCTDLLYKGNLAYIEPGNSNNIAHYPGTGGVIISNSKDKNSTYMKDICVAPPAQAAQEITLKILNTLAAQASTKEVDANLTASRTYDLSTKISKLYEQNERTLLLQYSLYRLCEAHMNGMFDPYENPIPELLKLQNENKNKDINQTIQTHLEHLVNVENKITTLIAEQKKLRAEDNKTSEILNNDQEIHYLKSLYYKNTYNDAFNKILDTAVELARIDKDKAVAEAERAKYMDNTTKLQQDLDEMNKRLINKVLCGTDCKDNNKSSVK